MLEEVADQDSGATGTGIDFQATANFEQAVAHGGDSHAHMQGRFIPGENGTCWKPAAGGAPYSTTYEWGYLHEALEIDGAHDAQLLFTPTINQDIHAIFLE